MLKKLSLNATAIGSLPHSNSCDAFCLVETLFKDIPFFPQLSNVNILEDMTFQILQNIPGVEFLSDKKKAFVNDEKEDFFIEVEKLYNDFENIIDGNFENIENYSIKKPYSSTFEIFLNKIKKDYNFAKGQIIGPFTLSTSLCDTQNKYIYYNETLRDIIQKSLILKCIAQIYKIKKQNKNIIPIIFLDEPLISHIGTSVFLTVNFDDVLAMLSDISYFIQKFGGLSGIHICSKAPWGNIIKKTNINIISFDAYSHFENLCLYSKELKNFIDSGSYLAWGMVPTLSENDLKNESIESLSARFKNYIDKLENLNIDKNKVIEQSIITPTCGCGGLSVEMAKRALKLTANLSDKLKLEYR